MGDPVLSGPGGAEGKWALRFRWLLFEFAGVQGRLHHAIHVTWGSRVQAGLRIQQEWRWGPVLGLVLHRLWGTPVSADGRHHPADPYTLDCKSFSWLCSPWDNFIIYLWSHRSHRYTIPPFLLISHNYNIITVITLEMQMTVLTFTKM